jgi:quercetin dioxygenase-like cupin family protein
MAGEGTTRQVLIGPEEGPNFALRRFIMQPGGGMPLHTTRVRIGEESHHVSAGDVVFIPAGVPHDYRADEGEEPFEFLCVVPNDPDTIALVDDPGC